jgi:hypothetical protein
MDNKLLQSGRALHNVDQGRGHLVWQADELELCKTFTRFCDVFKHIEVLEAVYSHSCEPVLRSSYGFVDELSGNGTTSAREVKVHPESGQLRDIIPPASAHPHAIHQLSEGEVFEYYLGEFDGQDGEWID